MVKVWDSKLNNILMQMLHDGELVQKTIIEFRKYAATCILNLGDPATDIELFMEMFRGLEPDEKEPLFIIDILRQKR